MPEQLNYEPVLTGELIANLINHQLKNPKDAIGDLMNSSNYFNSFKFTDVMKLANKLYQISQLHDVKSSPKTDALIAWIGITLWNYEWIPYCHYLNNNIGMTSMTGDEQEREFKNQIIKRYRQLIDYSKTLEKYNDDIEPLSMSDIKEIKMPTDHYLELLVDNAEEYENDMGITIDLLEQEHQLAIDIWVDLVMETKDDTDDYFSSVLTYVDEKLNDLQHSCDYYSDFKVKLLPDLNDLNAKCQIKGKDDKINTPLKPCNDKLI